MTEERFDIEITDKISPGISAKLKAIARDALAADTADLDVGSLVGAAGHTGVGQVGDAHQQALQFGLQVAGEVGGVGHGLASWELGSQNRVVLYVERLDTMFCISNRRAV